MALGAVALIAGCTNTSRNVDMEDAREIWDELWDVLGERYDVDPDSPCYGALDNTALVGSDDDGLEEIGCKRGGGCVLSQFPPDVPIGAYAIVINSEIGGREQRLVLAEELLHIADRCLARNYWAWPFLGGGHPEELFGGRDSVLAQVERFAQEL